MRKLLKTLKYIFYSILGLILIVCVGLLLYYQSIYKKTPLSGEVASNTALNSNVASLDKSILLPIPKTVNWTNGQFILPASIGFNSPTEDAKMIKGIIDERLSIVSNMDASGSFKFIKFHELNPQSYTLNILPNGVKIEYSDLDGLFYAMTTVKQLAKQSNNQLPCVQIVDQPDLKTRGVMLDISRGKIPSLKTLYEVVDFLADLKYNQLQLYIEGFSFGYPSFKKFWDKTETPLMPEEIRQLDAYCKARFIELVPNQNSLGHMNEWLKQDEYKDLAECPEGYKLFGLIDMKTTLSPQNPRSLALVEKMSEDLLPNFTSNKFNVDLDEPFELGKCKEHPIDDPKEVAKVYLTYAKQLDNYVKSKGKSMMMWGDVVSKNPEIIPEIPKDITLLEWRYESFQSFENICKQYQKSGLHYMVCPGTSSWSSFTGRTDNMMGNIENAVTNGIRYEASGMIVTDWGDAPHLQYLTISDAGFAYAAALSWNNNSESKSVLGSYLSKFVFMDSTNEIGNLILNMGRYNQFEEYPMPSMTTTSLSFMFGIMDKTMLDAINKKLQAGIAEMISTEDEPRVFLKKGFENPRIYNAKAIINFTDTLEQRLLQIHLNRRDSSLIIDEYKNALRMIQLGAKLNQFNNYHLQQTDAENKTLLTEMKALCKTIIIEHQRLWMIRNKPSGLQTSLLNIKNLEIQIDDNIELLNKNGIVRWGNRTIEKIKTAVGVLYLKSK